MINHNKKCTIGIIGCGGFIGYHLTKRILSTTCWDIIGIDYDSHKIAEFLGTDRIKFYQGNYTENNRIESIVANCDVVFSLASICNPSLYNTQPLDVIKSNYNDPCVLVDACSKHHKWLIHFSTSEVYGKTISSFKEPGENHREDYVLHEHKTPFLTGNVKAQRWSYANAKQLLERYIYAHSYTHQLPFTILRPFNFIGPKMDYIPGIDGEGVPRVLACFMDALLKNQPLSLVDGGHSMRTFTYIDDVIDLLMIILQNSEKSKNQIFNVGNAKNEVSIKDLAKLMLKIKNDILCVSDERTLKLQTIDIPASEFYGAGYEDSDRRFPDTSLTEEKLGWQAKTLLPHALRVTMEWFLNHYSNQNQPHKTEEEICYDKV